MILRLNRALALLETIIAIFLLTAGFIVIAALYHTALRHSRVVEEKHIAVLVAERKLEEIRSWSRRTHGTGGTDRFADDASWATYDGVTTTDTDYPNYSITVAATRHQLFAPSSQFESVRFSAQDDETLVDPPTAADPIKSFDGSTRRVEVTVSWGPSVTQRMTLVSLVGDPVRRILPDPSSMNLVMLPALTDMAPGSTRDFQVTLSDTTGQPVEDASFTWYIEADGTANGTLDYDPANSGTATFKNEVQYDPTDSTSVVTAPGKVRVGVRARIGGEEVVKWSPVLTLF